MAQEYEIQMKRYNGQDYDTLLPKPASHAASHALTGDDPLEANTVGTEQIVDGAITTPKIADNAVTKLYEATIYAEHWTGNAAPYTNNVTINGLLATDTPIVDMIASSDFKTVESEIEGYALIYKMTTSSNTLTVYATDKPEVNINIQLRTVKK